MSTDQTYASHGRYVPGYHYVLTSILLANFGIAVWQLIRGVSFASVWTVVMAVAFILTAWYARVFATAVQDRVIRLEERLRMERLLPDDLRPRIGEFSREQLVGLRFASDAELPELARAVLAERLTDKKLIKQRVRSWRPDDLRA